MKKKNLTVGLFSVLLTIIPILLLMGMSYAHYMATKDSWYGHLFGMSLLLALLIYKLHRCAIIFLKSDSIKIVFPFNPIKKAITLSRSDISMMKFRYVGVRFVQTHLTVILKGEDIIPASIDIVTDIYQFEARRLDKQTEIPIAIIGPM